MDYVPATAFIDDRLLLGSQDSGSNKVFGQSTKSPVNSTQEDAKESGNDEDQYCKTRSLLSGWPGGAP